ncbi:MAG: PAS domain S-box protein, partial [Actinomycetota bacterium]|nr:PAS domain S-box protein [Actinomycetota bacterium]
GAKKVFLDAGMIALLLAIAGWELVLRPYVARADLTPGEDLIGLLYPTMDLALVSVSVILLHGTGARSASNRLIAGAMALTIATDLVYASAVLDGTYRAGGWYDAGWLLSYALWGIAALHHSARTAPTPVEGWRSALRPGRLVMPVSVVVVTVLFLRGLQGRHVSVPVLVAGGGAVFLLALTRLQGLLRELHEQPGQTTAQRHAYRVLMEQASDAIFISCDGRYVDVNERACALTGYTREELLELPFGKLSAAAPREQVQDLLERLGRGELIVEEMVLTRKDGTTVPIESSARMLPDGRLQAIVRDISDRLESARALKASEEQFRRAFESPAAGMAVVAPDATILQINGTFAAMMAAGPSDLEGVSVVDLAHEDDRPALADAFAALAEGREDRARLEVRLAAVDGSTTWAEVSLAPAPATGGPATVVVHVVDQTLSKELEERLREAQKMEAIGQLAGGVAHDFNNLLSVIVNYTRFVQDSVAGDEQAEQDLGEVLKAAGRGERLVRQLLAFSRRERLRPELLVFDEVIADVADLLRRTIRESITLDLDLQAPETLVEVDRVQLEQVLLNLAVNARDAMPSGGTLRIRTARSLTSRSADAAVAPRGPFIHLVVSDTGCGMTEEVRARAFEPFFTTKERGSGTGLGLATVYGAVTSWGGSIDMVSASGRGTRFDVWVPVASEPAAVPEQRGVPDGSASCPATILVAEDEPSLRAIVRRILERRGYSVVVAESSRHALDLVTGGDVRFDLLVTDVVMPDVSGRELAEAVRRDRPDAGVLYMSGYTDQIVAEHGLFPDGDAFLPKPFTSDQLAHAVEGALRRARRADRCGAEAT